METDLAQSGSKQENVKIGEDYVLILKQRQPTPACKENDIITKILL